MARVFGNGYSMAFTPPQSLIRKTLTEEDVDRQKSHKALSFFRSLDTTQSSSILFKRRAMDDIQYNQNFGDEEYVEVIAYAIDRMIHTCHWLDGGGNPCNQDLEARDFNVHLRTAHGLVAHSQSYPCRWFGCSGGVMTRPGLERHVHEIHLASRWACCRCNYVGTRKQNLRAHLAGCSNPGDGGN
ncbi:hypothetical protein HYDPIDRAFT_119465, partial [Hydnomerulius pinastri MD-312]